MELMIVINIMLIASLAIMFQANVKLSGDLDELEAANVMLMDRTEDLHYRVGQLEMKEVADTAEFKTIFDDEEEDECEDGVCKIKF